MKHQLLICTAMPVASLCAFGATTELPVVTNNGMEAAQPALTEGGADSLYYNLHEIQVVGNRATSKTPVAFTNVDAEAIAAKNTGVDVPYLLLSTPSVITTSDAGTGIGYTSIRVRGTDGSRINVTANGIPINNAESHNVYWVDMPDLASALKDIQVQRGAGTSTNGAGAFGASINMLTATHAAGPYAQLDAAYGSYNTNRQSLAAGTGMLGDHWTADVRLSHIGTDGYIDRAWSKLWSYYGQLGYYNGSASVRLLAFGGKEDTYQAWDYASKEDMEQYGRRYNPCGQYTTSDGQTAYYPDQVDDYVMHNFQLIYNQALTADLKLNVALHYTRGKGYYEQYKTRRTLSEYGLQPYVDAEGNTVKKSDLVRLKNLDNGFGGGIFSLTYNRDRLSMVVGGGANNYKGHHFGQISWVRNYVGPIDPLQEYYRNNGRKFDANIYARASYDIWRGLSAYLDMQYRYIDYRISGLSDTYDWNIDGMEVLDYHNKYRFFNPKGGISYAITDHQRAYASVSVAHREPTRDNFVDNGRNEMPRAERLTDWELGYSLEGQMFSAGANVYYMDYKDQLVPTGKLSDTGNAVSVNVPHSYRLGLELQWMLRPVGWFDWQFTTTLSRNRVRDFTEYIYEDEWTNPITVDRGDTPLAFSPDLTLHNALNFHVAGFDASLSTRYVSKQYMTNTGLDETALDAYCVSDLALGYTFRNLIGIKELRLGMTVYNIFDARYCNNGYAGAGYYVGEDGSPVVYRYAGYAAQAPTNVIATASLKF